MKAIGFIETKGLVGAIEAADAMLKAANVRMLERTQVGGGLVTITVSGEVSAVQVAVDAAATSLSHIPGSCLVSRHVIPRPDEGVSTVINLQPSDSSNDVEPKAKAASSAAPKVAKAPKKKAEVKKAAPAKKAASAKKAAPAKKAPQAKSVAPKPTETAPVKAVAPVKDEPVTKSVVSTPEETAPKAVAPVKEEPKKSVAKSPKGEPYTAGQLKKMNVSQLRKVIRSLQNTGLTKAEIDSAKKKELIKIIMDSSR